MFTNLQVITTNSLMKSTLSISDLILKAKEQGHRSLALTDHNSLYGAIEFYETALKNDIKPILGLTLDVQGFIHSDKIYPLILLAKNIQGYEELIQLSTMYQLNDNQLVPLTEVILRSKNLIVISPGNDGEVLKLLESHHINEAKELTDYLKENIDHFYLGLSLQGVNENTLAFYRQTTTPKVALGNVQYLNTDDALPTKVLRVLESEMALGEENQAQVNSFLDTFEGDFSLRAPDEVYNEFKMSGFEAAAIETNKIAEQIHIELEIGHHIMPSFKVPKGETSDSYLRKLCELNLEKRVNNLTPEYQERLHKELGVISKMGFSDYFLIVWDIMVYAHKQNIYTGSGRGSAAGSLVAFLLEITNVDPLKYNLLFERFLNEERFTMPDIDLDFPDNRREEILLYVFNKYGSENVAQIGTIGKYGAKSAIRDVNRVYGQSQDEIRRWARAIPSGPDVTLQNSYSHSEFKNLVNENEKNRKVYEVARKIEGSNRHVSTHAAAVVISDRPITDRVPLQMGSGAIHLTQFTMESVEKVGLLKLDILGLRNLAILSDCIRFIPYENNGGKVDIDSIPSDDIKTLEIFRQAATDGVFQFESPGIRRVLSRLQPNSFEDIVAVNALYRPGPMEQIDTFIKRKNGQKVIRYPHDDLKEILEVTYGVMVYQEQVMQVASKLAGYTLNEADILRRAISKKDHDAIEKGRKTFVEGAIAKGYLKETALEVYGYIEQFADYGFNRSHAVAYSKVAYQLAYVKANYPASFFAAVMRASSKDKVKNFVAEAKSMDVEFSGPNINKSYQSFIIEQSKIRFGFEVINGLPRNFIQDIITERRKKGEFVNLIQFLGRINHKWLKEEYILPLIYSGAFDDLEDNRASLLGSLTSVLESIEMSHGNTELFQIFAPSVISKQDLTDDEKMKQEYESTGYYFSAEPGEKYKELRSDGNVIYLQHSEKNKYAKVLVVVEKITRIQTKNGEPMSFVDVIDNTGKANLTLFPNIHRRFIQLFNEGDTILVEGKIEKTQPALKIIANKITPAEKLLKEKSKTGILKKSSGNQEQILYIRFQSLQTEKKKREALQSVLKQYHGSIPVIIYDEETKTQKAFKEAFFVNNDEKLLETLEKMFGNDNFMMKTR